MKKTWRNQPRLSDGRFWYRGTGGKEDRKDNRNVYYTESYDHAQDYANLNGGKVKTIKIPRRFRIGDANKLVNRYAKEDQESEGLTDKEVMKEQPGPADFGQWWRDHGLDVEDEDANQAVASSGDHERNIYNTGNYGLAAEMKRAKLHGIIGNEGGHKTLMLTAEANRKIGRPLLRLRK